jgi:hypothetical protein
VAAHRRDDERLSTQRLEMLYGRLDDRRDIGNPPAAGSDRHGLAGLDLLAKIQPRQLGLDGGGNLTDGERGAVERLANAEDMGVLRHGGPAE